MQKVIVSSLAFVSIIAIVIVTGSSSYEEPMQGDAQMSISNDLQIHGTEVVGPSDSRV